jgi:hypothetical protein
MCQRHFIWRTFYTKEVFLRTKNQGHFVKDILDCILLTHEFSKYLINRTTFWTRTGAPSLYRSIKWTIRSYENSFPKHGSSDLDLTLKRGWKMMSFHSETKISGILDFFDRSIESHQSILKRFNRLEDSNRLRTISKKVLIGFLKWEDIIFQTLSSVRSRSEDPCFGKPFSYERIVHSMGR